MLLFVIFDLCDKCIESYICQHDILGSRYHVFSKHTADSRFSDPCLFCANFRDCIFLHWFNEAYDYLNDVIVALTNLSQQILA